MRMRAGVCRGLRRRRGDDRGQGREMSGFWWVCARRRGAGLTGRGQPNPPHPPFRFLLDDALTILKHYFVGLGHVTPLLPFLLLLPLLLLLLLLSSSSSSPCPPLQVLTGVLLWQGYLYATFSDQVAVVALPPDTAGLTPVPNGTALPQRSFSHQ